MYVMEKLLFVLKNTLFLVAAVFVFCLKKYAKRLKYYAHMARHLGNYRVIGKLTHILMKGQYLHFDNSTKIILRFISEIYLIFVALIPFWTMFA